MTAVLRGRTVMITRPERQSKELIDRIQALGGTTLLTPAIEIQAPEDFKDIDEALKNLPTFDWVVLTSVNGVDSMLDRMNALGIPQEHLSQRKIAVVGSATARTLTARLRQPDAIPNAYNSDAIVQVLGEVAGKNILLPRANMARKEIVENLQKLGANTTELSTYQIIENQFDIPANTPTPDFITLTSSAVTTYTLNNLKRLGLAHWFTESQLISIGPITTETIRELGFKEAAEATEATIPGLVNCLIERATGEPSHA